jgi:hypothetical protein
MLLQRYPLPEGFNPQPPAKEPTGSSVNPAAKSDALWDWVIEPVLSILLEVLFGVL